MSADALENCADSARNTIHNAQNPLRYNNKKHNVNINNYFNQKL